MELDFLILPVVFDDTRESGIRPDIRQNLQEQKVIVRLAESGIGRKILDVQRAGEYANTSGTTLLDRSEAKITAALEETTGWEDLCARVRGLMTLTMYRTRNTVFAITPSSTRRRIPLTYAANMAALAEVLSSAAGRGIEVLVYVPPLRSDVPRPYVPEEYEAFKAEVAAMTNRYGSVFAYLDNTVPGPFDGTKADTGLGGGPEYDFMPFQGKGHDLLTEALLDILEKQNLGF